MANGLGDGCEENRLGDDSHEDDIVANYYPDG